MQAMATSAQGQTEFAARVSRIETRGAGVAEVFNGGGQSALQKQRGRKRHPGKSGLIKVPLAFVSGAASFMVAEYATFRLGELPKELSDPDYILGGETALALAVFLIVRLIFELTGKMYFLLGLTGLVASITMMHNLVHMAPEIWAMAFSQEWVSELQSSTEPNTAMFRDIVIPLS